MLARKADMAAQGEAWRGGKIINIASLLSFQGGIRVPSYTASKSGVAGLTKLMANEWARHGINANAIAPGFITTAMTDKLTEDQKTAILKNVPAGRMGEAAEIAAAVLYLASPEAGYTTGTVLHVNGGLAMV